MRTSYILIPSSFPPQVDADSQLVIELTEKTPREKDRDRGTERHTQRQRQRQGDRERNRGRYRERESEKRERDSAYCCVCAPSDDYVIGCLLTRRGQQNVGHAPDG